MICAHTKLKSNQLSESNQTKRGQNKQEKDRETHQQEYHPISGLLVILNTYIGPTEVSSTSLTVLQERHPAHDEALVGGDDVQARPRAADHAGDVVQDVVALGLVLEELHVRVEHVSLRDVDPLA